MDGDAKYNCCPPLNSKNRLREFRLTDPLNSEALAAIRTSRTKAGHDVKERKPEKSSNDANDESIALPHAREVKHHGCNEPQQSQPDSNYAI